MMDNITEDSLHEPKQELETVLDYIARYIRSSRSHDDRERRIAGGKGARKVLLFPKIRRSLRHRFSQDTIAAMLFVVAIFCLILAVIFARIPNLSRASVLVAMILFTIALFKSIVYLYHEFQSLKHGDTSDSFLKATRRFRLNYYERLIEGLSIEYSLAELKTAETTLSLLLKEKQMSNRMFAKFTRVIAIFLVTIVYALLYQIAPQSNPIEYFKQAAEGAIEILYARMREVVALIILIAVGLNIIFEIVSRVFSLYEIHLIVLRRAIDIAKNRERQAAEILRANMKEMNKKRSNIERNVQQ